MDEDILLGRVEPTPHLGTDKGKQEGTHTAPPPPPPARIPRPTKWVVIDKIDDAFKKAVSRYMMLKPLNHSGGNLKLLTLLIELS